MRFILSVAMFAALSGCATPCLVESEPQGATVAVDEKTVGATPCTVMLEENWLGDSHQVRVSKPGYYAEVRTVAKTGSAFEKPRYPGSVFIRLAPERAAVEVCAICGKPTARDAAFCGACGARRP